MNTNMSMSMGSGGSQTMTMGSMTMGSSRQESIGYQPMLARVADAVFWMSRYVERSEHISRLVLVNTHVLADAGELAPELAGRIWDDLLDVVRPTDEWKEKRDRTTLTGKSIVNYLLMDPENSNSALNCVAKARENARAIREIISAEMWECLNGLYWSTRADTGGGEENPADLSRQLLNASFLFQGLTDQTITHGQAWLFAMLGRYLERVDMTCRVLSARCATLTEADDMLEPALRNIQWMAVLRACCSIEMYRHVHGSEVQPSRVAEFIILQRDFPRSIFFCVTEAQAALRRLSALLNVRETDEGHRVLGQLAARLEYVSLAGQNITEILEFVTEVGGSAKAAAHAVQERFFLR